jgi:hypothetical protein
VDLYGTGVVLEQFWNVMARGGSGVVISSQSGHRLPALTIEQNKALAMTPTEELLKLPFLRLDQVKDSLHGLQGDRTCRKRRPRGVLRRVHPPGSNRAFSCS